MPTVGAVFGRLPAGPPRSPAGEAAPPRLRPRSCRSSAPRAASRSRRGGGTRHPERLGQDRCAVAPVGIVPIVGAAAGTSRVASRSRGEAALPPGGLGVDEIGAVWLRRERADRCGRRGSRREVLRRRGSAATVSRRWCGQDRCAVAPVGIVPIVGAAAGTSRAASRFRRGGGTAARGWEWTRSVRCGAGVNSPIVAAGEGIGGRCCGGADLPPLSRGGLWCGQDRCAVACRSSAQRCGGGRPDGSRRGGGTAARGARSVRCGTGGAAVEWTGSMRSGSIGSRVDL
jgi:hypothetical protein